MNDALLSRLLDMRGPDFPPVARALAELPDDAPLKIAAAAMPEPPPDVAARLTDVEARMDALEAQAAGSN